MLLYAYDVNLYIGFLKNFRQNNKNESEKMCKLHKN
jgi:hypothetical protein